MPDIFPTLPGLAYSVIKRPKWFTGIATTASGREIRVGYAATPVWEWDMTFEYLPDMQTDSSAGPSDLKTLLGFYLSQSGALHGFLFEDPDDNAVQGQLIAVGDGTTWEFPLMRSFGASAGSGTEPIGGVHIDDDHPFVAYVNGVVQSSVDDYFLVTGTPLAQVIQFSTPPASGAEITCDMSFYFYVRFKDDTYDFEKFMHRLWSQRLITLKSLRRAGMATLTTPYDG